MTAKATSVVTTPANIGVSIPPSPFVVVGFQGNTGIFRGVMYTFMYT